LINERLAKNMLDWTHSGFSVDLTVKIPATSPTARVSLAQYIPRPTAGASLREALVPPCRSRRCSWRSTAQACCTAQNTIRTSAQTRSSFPR
jgi:hypothetical protein